MTLPGPRITYEDYKLLPEDSRYEVIEGELMVTPAPNIRHQRVFRQLFVMLAVFVQSHELGEVLSAPTDVILSEHNVVQPDILFVARDRLAILDPTGGVRGAPDLAVEILSPGTASRDQVIKRKLYAQHGVHEYWVVDPIARTIAVLTQTPDGLEPWRVFGAGETVTSPLLPELAIALREVFKD